MPNSSESAHSAFFETVVPSKIFDIKHFESVHPEHNRSIAALTDPAALGYIQDIDQIVSVLTDPEIAQYQDKLLQEAVKGICAEKVDIDHIQIGLKLTEQDITSLLDPDSGLTCVKTKDRRARLNVTPLKLGTTNKGFKKGDLKPFFTHRYLMIMDHDAYRYMNVFIADPNHPRNDRELRYNCLIECIPTRLTPQHISLMLFHVKSALKPNRYDQLIKHALLLRLDTGYVMHGVSQIFAFIQRKEERNFVGSCIPSDGRAVETTYIGEQGYNRVIAYDKVLKENKLFVKEVLKGLGVSFKRIAHQIEGIESWFPRQIASLRIESRDLMSKKIKPLSELDKCISFIGDITFLRPNVVANLDTEELSDLVKHKTTEELWDLRHNALAKLFNFRNTRYLYKFSEEKVNTAFQPILAELKNTIYNPSGSLAMPALDNYSQNAINARKIIKPLIDNLRTEHDSPDVIVSCSKPAIYVEGCPGAGKTSLIVKRVQHLIATGTKAENICVLAFTREAKNEFKKRLDDSGLLHPNIFVGTFSSWCKIEILGRKKSKVLDQKASIKKIKSILRNKDQLLRKFESEELARIIVSIMSYAANFNEPMLDKCIHAIAPQLNDIVEEIKDVIEQFEKGKQDKNEVDFNDLLVKSRESLRRKKIATKLSKHFNHIILDEVQDTNIVQWQILEYLYKVGSNLFCVGDPAQSMFGFRGASAEKLRRFSEIFNNAKVYQLIENHRSTPQIVKLANYLRNKINDNYSQSKAVLSDGLLPRYVEVRNLKSAIDWIIADIKALDAQEAKIDCLILCRYKTHKDSVKDALVFEEHELNHVKVDVHTYHGSKGLEAVNCYVVDPLFSNYRLGTIKEELCNTYVAFTRAKNMLAIIASEKSSALYGTSDNNKMKTSIFAQLYEDFENEEDEDKKIFNTVL